jgi:NitT/TauT family transport system ATP-binding protein
MSQPEQPRASAAHSAAALVEAPLVDVRGVGKTFRNGTVALAGIDLAVAPGAFVSLLGPSGCGKSTLLRLIAGLTPPSTGHVALSAATRGRIGFVFQEPTLMPWATVWDNAYLPLRLMGQSRAEAAPRIEATLAAVGLESFARVYPRELSGGMKMRVSIARALVTEPQLLLLDEPFAALDEITRFKLNEDLLALWQRQHWTVIFVTHSVFESVFLSNRIVVMTRRPGRIVADVPIELAYPREAGLRTAPDYTARCAQLSAILAQAAA